MNIQPDHSLNQYLNNVIGPTDSASKMQTWLLGSGNDVIYISDPSEDMASAWSDPATLKNVLSVMKEQLLKFDEKIANNQLHKADTDKLSKLKQVVNQNVEHYDETIDSGNYLTTAISTVTKWLIGTPKTQDGKIKITKEEKLELEKLKDEINLTIEHLSMAKSLKVAKNEYSTLPLPLEVQQLLGGMGDLSLQDQRTLRLVSKDRKEVGEKRGVANAILLENAKKHGYEGNDLKEAQLFLTSLFDAVEKMEFVRGTLELNSNPRMIELNSSPHMSELDIIFEDLIKYIVYKEESTGDKTVLGRKVDVNQTLIKLKDISGDDALKLFQFYSTYEIKDLSSLGKYIGMFFEQDKPNIFSLGERKSMDLAFDTQDLIMHAQATGNADLVKLALQIHETDPSDKKMDAKSLFTDTEWALFEGNKNLISYLVQAGKYKFNLNNYAMKGISPDKLKFYLNCEKKLLKNDDVLWKKNPNLAKNLIGQLGDLSKFSILLDFGYNLDESLMPFAVDFYIKHGQSNEEAAEEIYSYIELLLDKEADIGGRGTDLNTLLDKCLNKGFTEDDPLVILLKKHSAKRSS